jgi:acetyl-CoA acetyltransferase
MEFDDVILGRRSIRGYKPDPVPKGIGPVPATRKVMERTGLKAADFDVIESNEAFASQACAVMQELGLDPEKVNPNGSGISLGHPVGATGAIITTKAIAELPDRWAICAGDDVHRRRPGYCCGV